VASSNKHISSDKKGRMLLMKTRLNPSEDHSNSLGHTGMFVGSRKQQETTPIKGATKGRGGLMSSEERNKLFSTFMKEMTQSMSNPQPTSSKKKRGTFD